LDISSAIMVRPLRAKTVSNLIGNQYSIDGLPYAGSFTRDLKNNGIPPAA
jgi:hypothetical protein